MKKTKKTYIKNKFKNKNLGFTLIELIVVITILAILGTLAFIGLQKYILNARDSVRTSDMKGIQTALGIYTIEKGKYPEPTNAVNITYSGATVWSQGTFGYQTFTNVRVINKIPLDPLKSVEYAYSVTSDRQDYQLVGILEDPQITSYKSSFINSTYADSSSVSAYSVGNYNGIVTKVSTGGIDYALAIPSVFSNSTTQTDLGQIVSNKSFIYNNYGNLPSNFSGAFLTNQKFDFTPNKLVVYSGSFVNLKELSDQMIFLKNVQDAYNGSIIVNDDKQIRNIVENLVDVNNPSSRAKTLACNLINFNLKYFIECNHIDYLTFYIINTLHIDINNLPGNSVNTVFRSVDGNLRFGTNDGIGLYDGSFWTIFNKDNSGLVHNVILAISQDVLGNMWFGTNLGISKYDGINWETINTKNSGLLNNHILEIYTGPDGTMWIGTNNGVNSYDSGVWADYTKKSTGLSHDHVNAIYEDNLGNIWFGTDVGLDKYLSGVITRYTTSEGLPDNRITYIIQDLNNDMWIGTQSGLSKYNWTTFITKNVSNTTGGLPDDRITYIYQNNNNSDLWFGTKNGAAKYVESSDKWTVYNTSNELSGNIINSINQNTDGSIVITSDGGIDIIKE
ncbi:MAG: two-component regulator propeller domain-containing protein [Candidatus Gracilibacteria bacterium]